MTEWKACLRSGCTLTALWQCGVQAYLGIDPTDAHCSHLFVTNLVVCGMHKEEVRLEDFERVIDAQDPQRTHHHTLWFKDISEGSWINTKYMREEKY